PEPIYCIAPSFARRDHAASVLEGRPRDITMATVSPILAEAHHDHGRCAADALRHAEATARREGLRLTDQRRSVLAALLQSHVPASAYDVIDRLADESGRRPAPVTVYRALEFLVEHRFAHR